MKNEESKVDEAGNEKKSVRLPNLLQSELWANLQKKTGRRVHIIENGNIRGVGIIERLPLAGNFLYFPRGPILGSNVKDQRSKIEEKLSRLAKKERMGWVRIEPENEETLNIFREMFKGKMKTAPHPVQPAEIFAVSLEGTSDQWLARMKPKTRYNVRLAEKHGVTTRFSRMPKDVDGFLGLIRATAGRKGIVPHPDNYYQNFFETLGENECTLALAEHAGELLAAGLIVFYAGTAFYLHGGSSEKKRNLMAPFLLHFSAMEEAKRRGCKHYDFGGVATQNSKLKDWAGITRFKLGFAPHMPTTSYPGTFDIVFDGKRYFLYRLLSRLSNLRKYWRQRFIFL